MSAKIMLINGTTETLVGTMKSNIEAFQAASLFNAMLTPESKCYYVVDWKDGKTHKRSSPDNFCSTVSNISTLYHHLKFIF